MRIHREEFYSYADALRYLDAFDEPPNGEGSSSRLGVALRPGKLGLVVSTGLR